MKSDYYGFNPGNTENLSDMEKLKLIHNFIKFLIQEEILPNKRESLKYRLETLTQTIRDDADIIFRFMADLYECGDLPQVLPDRKYKKVNQPKLFRSANEFDHLANLLADQERHYGWGLEANGIYADKNKIIAHSYHPHVFSDKHIFMTKPIYRLLEFKLEDDTIIANSKELKYAFKSACNGDSCFDETIRDRLYTLCAFLSSITYDKICDEELFISMLDGDAGKLGIILGIDTLVIDAENGKGSYAVLNRKKMIVSQTEFNRICIKSNAYKNLSTHKKKPKIHQAQPGED